VLISASKPCCYVFLVVSLHAIYFLHLQSTLCTHTCHISYILLLCSAAQKMNGSLMKTSFKRAGPGHLPVAWCLFLLFRSFDLVIGFILRLNVINTNYIVYFTNCRFMCKL
jgi:hypothetical protein